MRAITHFVADPERFAIKNMGRVAVEASNLPTVREWAALVVANHAKPRDDIDALRSLYDAVLSRWGYVREPDEWVVGDPRRLIGLVLGVKYNTREAPERARIGDIPSTIKGWGDCDDVSTLVAALVRAVGMRPYFRVVRWPAGGHVSVMAQTPSGKWVSVDPVGYPEHPFGWRLDQPDVTYYDLSGRVVGRSDPIEGEEMTLATEYSMAGLGCATLQGSRPFLCAAVPGLPPGPRSLAMDPRAVRLASQGIVLDGMQAFDQHGQPWHYCARRDVMMPGLGSIRRKRRKAKRRRVFRRVARRVSNVGRQALKSPLLRTAVSAAGQAVGIPAPATAAALMAANRVVNKRSRGDLAKSFARSPRKTATMIARAAPALAGAMAGDDAGAVWMVGQGRGQFPAYPVIAMSGIPGAVYLGDLVTAPTPTPGAYYRVQSGDSLLKVAGKAFGLGAGGARLKAAKLINDSPANAVLVSTTNTDNLFPGGKIQFSRLWSADPELAAKGVRGESFPVIWIPAVEGDLPPTTPTTPDTTPETDSETEQEVEEVTPDVSEEKVPDVQTPDVPDPSKEDEEPIEPIKPIEPDILVPQDDVIIPPVEPVEPIEPGTDTDDGPGGIPPWLDGSQNMKAIGTVALVGGAAYLGYRMLKGKKRR